MGNLVSFSAPTPEHIRRAFGVTSNDDLMAGINVGYPVISYKGKTWAIVEADNRTIITRPGDEDDEPAPFIEVVIVKANPNLSKVYYKDGYVEGGTEKPTCYSNDGKVPAADSTERQSKTCATCPHNVWGSRLTEQGSKGKACSDSRRLCVVPGGQLDRPMLLRVPAGTLRELVAYADLLKQKKVPYQAVVTRIGFDREVAHPKFTFKPTRFLEAHELDELQKTAARDIVNQIVGAVVASSVEEGPANTNKPSVSPETREKIHGIIDKAVSKAEMPIEKERLALAPQAESDVAEPDEAPRPKPVKSKGQGTKPTVVQADKTLDRALSHVSDDDE